MPEATDIPPRQALISVIVPIHNTRQYLKEAVDSLRAQNWPNLQVIAVDDGSTDGSAEEWERLAPEFKLIRTGNNSGPSAARNIGLSHATGQYITFLDSDDIWPDGKLEIHVSAFEAEPELRAVLGELSAFADLPGENGVTARKFVKPHFLFLLGGMLCRRDVFDQVGHFDEIRFPFNNEDTDWFYRAWEQGHLMRILDRTTILYRRRPGSLTSGKDQGRIGMPSIIKASLDRRRGAVEGKRSLPDTLLFPASYNQAPGAK